jgi:putative DNA primase/helicase
MELEQFLSKLDGVRRLPSGVSARCPAHDDHVASLTVSMGKGGNILAYCHAGCAIEEVVSAMGLAMASIRGRPYLETTYFYTDEARNTLYEIDRWANPKDFRVRPSGIPEAQRVPYRLDALAWAREHVAPVWICEGEKDCDRLASLGLVATTNAFGKGKWLDHYSPYVMGCPVIVAADNDEAGRQHAREVAASVAPYAASVTMVVPRYGKDVSDLLDAGWTLDEMDPLPEEDTLRSILASNVTIKSIKWAWQGYVPLGKVTIFEGDPGDGKSILTVDLTARWTSGQAMPDGQSHEGPWPVVMITAEDDPEDTVVPRLVAAGADLKLVRLVDHGVRVDKAFNVSTDAGALCQVVRETGAKVIVVDPLMAMLDTGTDSNTDASVRQGLYPLYRVAKDTGAAVIVVRHLNKGEGRKAIYRGGGSIAFIGAARAAYTVGRDPENLERRVIACVKMNIAKEPPSLSYSIEYGTKGPYLEWHGIVEADAQEILDGSHNPRAVEILEFLNSVVENGEPLSWSAIVAAGRKEGYTEGQLRGQRGRSRLVKIVGGSGQRSIKWGYQEHTLRSTAHLQDGAPFTPFTPIYSTNRVLADSADGPASTTNVVKMAVNGENGSKWESVELDEEERHEQEMKALPSICQICGSEDSILKFGKPFWVVRCRNHNPRTYREGS